MFYKNQAPKGPGLFSGNIKTNKLGTLLIFTVRMNFIIILRPPFFEYPLFPSPLRPFSPSDRGKGSTEEGGKGGIRRGEKGFEERGGLTKGIGEGGGRGGTVIGREREGMRPTPPPGDLVPCFETNKGVSPGERGCAFIETFK